MNVEIDITHETSHGRTNCDLFDFLQAEKNCVVGIDVDVKHFWNIIFSCLRSQSHE